MLQYTFAIVAGAVIGFAMAVPIGPISIIVIQRTIARSKMAGLITGFGAMLADAFIASIAAFGIQAIFVFIEEKHTLIRVIGGLILLIFGIISIRSKPREHEQRVETLANKIEYFFSAIVLTLTNPFTVVAFFLAFANIQPYLPKDGIVTPSLLVIGVMIGSLLWWLLVTHFAENYEHKLTPEKMNAINKWLGALVVLIAVVMLTSSVLLK